MGGIRFLVSKSISGSIGVVSRTLVNRGCNDSRMSYGMRIGDWIHARSLTGCVNNSYHTDSRHSMVNSGSQVHSRLGNPCDVSGFSMMKMGSGVPNKVPAILTLPGLGFQSMLSHGGGRGYSSKAVPDVSGASGASKVDVSGGGGIGGGEWMDKFRDGLKSVVDVVAYTEQKAKEVYAEFTPYAQQVLDSHPYLRDFVVPVSSTLTATLMAWLVMPKILRRFHRLSNQGPATLLSGSIFGGEVLYEKSFWGALEDPVRYLITFMSFSQIAMMVAPTSIASHYIGEAWRGAIIISFVWFIHRWKTNVFSRALAIQSLQKGDRERLLTLDKVSSVGLFAIGSMALAEACGVAVQSILTVGGIGGVATAFAARDILGNVLSGLSMQFWRPFSLGDTIKAGVVEGQVMEMGLTTTSLLSDEKFPVIVPNSMFSSQIIVNKSRAPWRGFVSKIPLRFDNLEEIPQVSVDIKSMLMSHPKVFLDKEAPYCFLSQIDSYAELTVGCNLKQMRKEELFATRQDILLQSVRIIKQHGLILGGTYDTNNP
ncbi:hypothetical protein Droror1_Dr00000540 [Drosera rotundifolia]